MRALNAISCLFLLLLSCTTPIDFDLEDNPYIVVDGFVSDHLNRTYVNLYESANFNGESGRTPIIEADVQITCETTGEVFALKSAMNNGIYSPIQNSFKGEVGHQYSLQIYFNGINYHSDSETLTRAVPFSLHLIKELKSEINSSLVEVNKLGIGVYVSMLQDTANTAMLRQKWDWKVSYEINNNTITLFPEGHLQISKTDIVNDQKLKLGFYKKQSDQVALRTFTVIQKSLSHESYDYWGLIKSQLESTGSIFDAQPSTITGNIHSDHSLPVLGYFSAGAEIISQDVIQH